jgi:iron complex transport system substrate-binding protein
VTRRITVGLVALAVLAAACGTDDDAAPSDSTAAPAATEAPSTTATPTTAAPTTAAPTTSAPTTEPSPADADDPAAAASAAWALVFDSSVAFDDKAAHLAEADTLRPTVEAYAGAGAGFGGISLVPTAVAVDGDAATITYDVNFGANPAYSDQSGTITLIDGVWTVSRDEFCSFMASARLSCA